MGMRIGSGAGRAWALPGMSTIAVGALAIAALAGAPAAASPLPISPGAHSVSGSVTDQSGVKVANRAGLVALVGDRITYANHGVVYQRSIARSGSLHLTKAKKLFRFVGHHAEIAVSAHATAIVAGINGYAIPRTERLTVLDGHRRTTRAVTDEWSDFDDVTLPIQVAGNFVLYYRLHNGYPLAEILNAATGKSRRADIPRGEPATLRDGKIFYIDRVSGSVRKNAYSVFERSLSGGPASLFLKVPATTPNGRIKLVSGDGHIAVVYGASQKVNYDNPKPALVCVKTITAKARRHCFTRDTVDVVSATNDGLVYTDRTFPDPAATSETDTVTVQSWAAGNDRTVLKQVSPPPPDINHLGPELAYRFAVAGRHIAWIDPAFHLRLAQWR